MKGINISKIKIQGKNFNLKNCENINKKKMSDGKIVKDTSKRTKKVKEGPVRAKSSYLQYCVENRPVIISQNEGIKNTEIVTKLAEGWNAIKNSENKDGLQKYEEMARLDKERYSREKEAWDEEQKKSATESTPVVEEVKKKGKGKKAVATESVPVIEKVAEAKVKKPRKTKKDGDVPAPAEPVPEPEVAPEPAPAPEEDILEEEPPKVEEPLVAKTAAKPKGKGKVKK
jgi:HMG (high mobility group) box